MPDQKLIRGLGLASATALNMIDMIGVGPFITMPLVVAAMGGPQALLGWIAGALLAICDGLVWAELGAAMPGSGGSYVYLREIYGPARLGKLVSFLFIWQLSFSAPLSVASGALGFAKYTAYLLPSLETQYAARQWVLHLPLLGPLQLGWVIAGTTCSGRIASNLGSVANSSSGFELVASAMSTFLTGSGMAHFSPLAAV